MNKYIDDIRNNKPLVHMITNYVSANDCANALLALGCSPIMADDKLEVKEILRISSALVINIGTINRRTFKSMIVALKEANKKNIPVVLDPVGVCISKFRRRAVKKLLRSGKFSVIKGNISEIKYLAGINSFSKGVDAGENDLINQNNIEENIKVVKYLSKKLNTVVVVTGKTDIVAFKESVRLIKNGDVKMSQVTGVGCMLGAMIGGIISINNGDVFERTKFIVGAMAISGELIISSLGETYIGNGSFRAKLLDNICKIDDSIEKEFNFEDK